MVSRRAVLVASGPALAVATVGCSAIRGDGVEFAATPATVSSDATAGTGYREVAIEDVVVTRELGSHGATMLGQPTTVEKYEGSGAHADVRVGTAVHVARVEHEGDFVLALAIYPDQLGDEDGTVARLVGGIRHGG